MNSKKIFIIFIILIMFVLFSNTTSFGKSPTDHSSQEENDNLVKEAKIVDNEVIVIYSKDDWMTDIKSKMESVGKYEERELLRLVGSNHENIEGIENILSDDGNIKVSLIKSDNYSTNELIDLLKNKPYVKSVMPNVIYPLQSLTNDPYLQYQYALEAIPGNGYNADADINPMSTYSEEEKVIAIIDTGAAYEGTEIESALWTNPYDKSIIPGTHGYNFANHDDNINDEYGHGTLIASQIAAKANDGIGIAGSILDSPNIKIMVLNCYQDGGLNVAAVYEAYNYIIKVQELGTNVVSINNSWGSFDNLDYFDSESKVFKPLIEMAGTNGALSVMAAGNDGVYMDKTGKGKIPDPDTNDYVDKYYFPSGIDSDYIITVGATNESGDFCEGFSNKGEGVDIAAPGKSILGLQLYNAFSPSLLSEDERNNYCETFYDFDDDDLSLFENVNNEKITITTTDDIFYGDKGKSAQITFNVSEEDIANSENGHYEITIPLKVDIGKQMTAKKYVDLKLSSDKVPNELGQGDSYVVTPCLSDGSNELELFNHSKTYSEPGWKSWVSSAYISDYFNSWFHPEEEENLTMYLKITFFKPGVHNLYVDDFAVSKSVDDIDIEIRKNYYENSGTSFAAPFVAGAIATYSNIYENYDALQLKDAILDNAVVKPRFNNMVNGNKMLNIYRLFGKTTIAEDITNFTNKDITISITSNNHNEGVITQYKIDDGEWLDYDKPFIVSENCTIYTRVKDLKDTLECQSLTITNIDREAPLISGIENKVYQEEAELPMPVVVDNNEIQSVILIKDGNIVENYNQGDTIDSAGDYELKAIDSASNETIAKFTILPVYTIKESPNTNLSEIIDKNDFLKDPITLLNVDGNVVEDTTSLKTGMKIKVNDTNIFYTIIIKGDLNSSGTVTIADLALVQRKILNLETNLSDIFTMAGDIDDNKAISIKDLASIQKYILTGQGL